jgi:hypothetical protein
VPSVVAEASVMDQHRVGARVAMPPNGNS